MPVRNHCTFTSQCQAPLGIDPIRKHASLHSGCPYLDIHDPMPFMLKASFLFLCIGNNRTDFDRGEACHRNILALLLQDCIAASLAAHFPFTTMSDMSHTFWKPIAMCIVTYCIGSFPFPFCLGCGSHLRCILDIL